MHPHLEAPVKATLSITNACPLFCEHCYSNCSAAPGPDELSTTEWRNTLRKLADAGIISLLIEGGEPLLRPDIYEILEFCRGTFFTWLRTHAVDVDPGTARRLKELGTAAVSVDLFGATMATHDRHSGVDGSFLRSRDGIANLVAAGLDVVPLMIMTRRNILELQDFLHLARDLGCERAAVLRLYPVGRARESWAELACSLEEMTRAIASLAPPPGLQLLQSWHPKNGNCCWENAAITATGVSVGCPYLRDDVDYGNIRELDFLETWNHPLYRKLRGGPSGAHYCAGCERHEGTRGGCRATAFAFTGDWDGPDPFCRHQNHGIDLRALPDARLPARAEPEDTPRA
ncbi:MAG TPA: radical SAM protein [Microvirga sp.]|nr:radical SAM protein [Microvirga sp.]